MAKVILYKYTEGIDAITFKCPGCGLQHYMPTYGWNERPPEEHARPYRWRFNGNFDKPSLHPSLRVKSGEDYCCHFFITEGQICFQSDCTHELNAQTVDLPEIETNAR